MKPLRLFVLLVVAGGAGAFVGSVLGGAFGKNALFVGGLAGGVITSGLGAWLAGRLRWARAEAVRGAALGAMLAFALAAAIAVNTLSSPVGPVLSTVLVGAGGVAGGWLGAVLASRRALHSFSSMGELTGAIDALATRLDGGGHATAAAHIRDGIRAINGLTDGWALVLEGLEKVDAGAIPAHERAELQRLTLAMRWTVSRR